MNKQQFMNVLNKHLAPLSIDERNDLLSEYENHFVFAMQSGKSEEEIVRELGDPIELAKETLGDRYIDPNQAAPIVVESSRTLFSVIMLIFVNMFMLPIGLSFWVSVLAIGFSGLAFIVSPLLVVIDVFFTHDFYVAKLFASITMVGIGILVCIGTYFVHLGLWKVTKSYFKWNIATVRGSR